MDISWIDHFFSEVKTYIHVREEDQLLILIPNQAYRLNATALDIVKRMFRGEKILDIVSSYGDDPAKRRDIHYFFCDLRASVSGCLGEGEGRKGVERVTFKLPFNKLPVLSEIAVTYRCNLDCAFCYASCGCRAAEGEEELGTGEIKRILDIIRDEADVPSTSFTGGEPTLRDDLPELILHARAKGLWVNLITNGVRVSRDYAGKLKECGLNSAQVSVEGPDRETHEALTRVEGSFSMTLRGIESLMEAGIPVHTNTTVNRKNIDVLEGIVALVKSMNLPRLSMNLVIPCGAAYEGAENLWVTYTEMGERLVPLKKKAREEGVELMWYSPTPYCIFNPIAEGLGSKGCSACDGLLSVSPKGEVLPCSSYDKSMGNILTDGFSRIWNSPEAVFFQEKGFAHDICGSCRYLDICNGACPLYWKAVGYGELEAARESGKGPVGL